ncbi:HCP-like protein [Amylocystis lapponica]|nr:HCP-like protein [Amylocystis lapponica]
MRHQHPSTSALSSRSPSAQSLGGGRPSASGGPASPSRTPDFTRSAPPSQAAFARAQGGSPSPSTSSSVPSRPPRPPSPASLYSAYSYYAPDAAAPSPTASSPGASSLRGFPPPSPTATLSPTYVPAPKPPSAPTTPTTTAPGAPTTPQDYLQLGIQHHEANRLVESAACFEQSATLQGGCGVGMLMWGLAQRHGWGCEKNEHTGFRWLRRAAEVAVDDLERTRQGVNTGAVKSELVLAIYEVGQSFYRGWGVEKDKKMAVSYFRTAAHLGDPDAQQELAFCLANGKGCKKDRREAAQWYRAAVAQGVSDIGLAWIYKEKYQ